MKILISIILIISLNACTRQKDNFGTEQILSKQNFLEFKTYFDTITSGQCNDFMKTELTRDLFGNYKEGMFICTHLIPSDKEYPKTYIEHFNLKVIYNGENIVLYNLNISKSIFTNNVTMGLSDTIYNYSNKKLLHEFKNNYQQKYLIELKEDDLLNFDIIYGQKCGYNLNQTEQYLIIDSLITSVNRVSLLNWLKSINTEKQVYALYGYSQLIKDNILPNKDELKFIEFIKTKKGKINTCSGCNYSREEISEVIKELNL